MPVPAGERLVVSCRGYATRELQLSAEETDGAGGSYSTLITMQEQITLLSPIEVTPYMNEAQFKRAVLGFDYTSYHFLLSREKRLDLLPQRVVSHIYSIEQQQMRRRTQEPSYLPFTDILLRPLIRHIKKKAKD